MKILTSSGTSDQPESAYLNALAGVIGQMNDGVESRIVSKRVESTPNGFVVHIQVEVVEESDLELNEESDKGGEGRAINADGSKNDKDNGQFFDAAAYYSAQAIEKEREEIAQHAFEELAHSPAEDIPELPHEFEQVAEETDRHDPSYLHAGPDMQGDNITTKMDTWEIAAAATYELLSSDDVKWSEREADNQNEPKPEEQTFEKKAKTKPAPPPQDELNLVA